MTVTKSLTMDTGTGGSYSLHQLFRSGLHGVINNEIKRQMKGERKGQVISPYRQLHRVYLPLSGLLISSDHTIAIFLLGYSNYHRKNHQVFPYFPIPLVHALGRYTLQRPTGKA